jgi:CheY-like chemotaxis protein
MTAAEALMVPSPPSTIVSQERIDVGLPLEASLRGVRVLILDDDQDARKVLTRLLVDFDATVANAGSVDKAMAMITAFIPHVVVSDIGMPGQDGYDFVRQLRRRDDGFCRVPAIALTAFSGRENELRALQEGFQIHLPKPVNPSTLVAAIGKLVDRNAVEDEARGIGTRGAIM